jgi:hypothetical protein
MNTPIDPQQIGPQAERAAAVILAGRDVPLSYEAVLSMLRSAWLQGYSDATWQSVQASIGKQQ